MNKVMVAIAIVMLLAGCSKASAYQIVEKGEYSRLQYITAEGVMAPEFIKGYYVVVRNGNTGKEDKVEVSEEEYRACVVGDVWEEKNDSIY